MLKKQIEGIGKVMREPDEIYFGRHKSEFFKTSDNCVCLFDANGVFFIKFKNSKDIDYILNNYKMYESADIDYNSIVKNVYKKCECSEKLYDDVNFNWFKSRVTYDKKRDRKVVDLLDENIDVIMNFKYISRIFEIIKGSVSFNFNGSSEPVILENENYYVCLMPIRRDE